MKIVCTQPVLDLMRKLEEPKRKQWTPVFGAEWVQRWTRVVDLRGSSTGQNTYRLSQSDCWCRCCRTGFELCRLRKCNRTS